MLLPPLLPLLGLLLLSLRLCPLPQKPALKEGCCCCLPPSRVPPPPRPIKFELLRFRKRCCHARRGLEQRQPYKATVVATNDTSRSINKISNARKETRCLRIARVRMKRRGQRQHREADFFLEKLVVLLLSIQLAHYQYGV
jgi:hypothetical protein